MTHREGPGPRGEGRERAGGGGGVLRWGVSVVVTGLLMLVAIGLDGSAGTAFFDPAGGVLPPEWAVVLALLALAAAAMLVIGLRVWRTRLRADGPRARRMLALLTPGVLVLGLAGGLVGILYSLRHRVRVKPARHRPLPQLHQPHHWSPQVEGGVGGVIALVVVLLAIHQLAWWYRHGRRGEDGAYGDGTGHEDQSPAPVGDFGRTPHSGAALAEAVKRGRGALAGEDARSAIIACYVAMEESLAATEYPGQDVDTPEELLRRAEPLLGGGGGGSAARELAELFREARFSTHPVGREESARARAALEDIGDRLRERVSVAEEDGRTARRRGADRRAAVQGWGR